MKTPEQRAKAVAEAWWTPGTAHCGWLEDNIADAIRAAVEEEREACARICDAARAHDDEPDDLATKIRARGERHELPSTAVPR